MSGSLYDPSVLQTSPQAVAHDLKRIFVGGIEQLKAVHQQMLLKLNSVDRAQLDPLVPSLEQDYRALIDFISRFDPQWGGTLPARQSVQAMGGPTPRPMPDENIDPETLQPLTRNDIPNQKIEYNDENVDPASLEKQNG